MYGGMPGSRDHNADGGGLAEDSLVLPDLIRSGNCRLPTAVLQHSLWLLPCSQVVCRVKSATMRHHKLHTESNLCRGCRLT